jgi:hypothetical protein
MLWELGNHLRERLIFKAKNIKSVGETKSNDKTSLRVNFEIGEDVPPSDEGTNIYWKMTEIGDPPEYFWRLGLPRDCGCGIVFDFLMNENATEEEAKTMCVTLKLIIMNHFGDELNRSQQFRGLFIFPSKNIIDSVNVIRIAFVFRRQISVDSFLHMMHIPYHIHDIVNHFSGEITTNVNIVDMFDKTTVPMDSFFRSTVHNYWKYILIYLSVSNLML